MDSLIKQFKQTSQLAGGNAAFIEDLYEQYLADAASVSPAWKVYFDGFHGREAGDVPHSAVVAGVRAAARAGAPQGAMDDETARKQTAVGKLVTAYRSRGHLGARLDPLGMLAQQDAPDLDLPFHGLSEA
ncbi:MAG: 2-oxoglutarate dehydrogenase E1 component, partial [Arenimonas sp.]|nr:2-oxoglutarate dehydrogenase E1 component [Arenimonas sp.]